MDRLTWSVGGDRREQAYHAFPSPSPGRDRGRFPSIFIAEATAARAAIPAAFRLPPSQYSPLSFVYESERRKILILEQVMNEQDRRIADTIERERGRLRSFIRERVPNREDAEDLLQDVFFELVEAYRLVKPIEQAGAWLFRVAQNRIIDRFRKKKREASTMTPNPTDREDGDVGSLEDMLPSPDAGPEAAYAREVLLDQLDAALEELPEEQRFVFVAHELEGRSFRELASATGVAVNTLLSRKHYAVLHLRRRLQHIYDEFKEK
jgi:RNA polymerase sigma factor (sigma-70 family)